MIGRDGCRVPLPWSSSQPNFGYGGPPHLPQPDWFGKYAVDEEEHDPKSSLSLYRHALGLRKKLQTQEKLEFVDSEPGVLHFSRPNGWQIATNFTDHSAKLPKGHLILSSTGDLAISELPAQTTVWLKSD